MQIVIDIDKKEYDLFIGENYFSPNITRIKECLVNGTPLPKGHGRLIDADALINSLGVSDRDIYCEAVIEEDAPTIIEADKE